MIVARLLWALLLCCLVQQALAQSPQLPTKVEKPNFKLGDTWVYNKLDGWSGNLLNVSVNTLRKMDSSGYMMESVQGFAGPVSKVLRDKNFNMFRIEADKFEQNAKPFYPNYVFPLSVGQRWKQKVEMTKSTDSNGKVVVADLESRVVGWEMVTVPAGNFVALKIETSGWYNGSISGWAWGGQIHETLWFAPEVRNAVRYEYQDRSSSIDNHEIHELQSYWLAP